MPGTQQEFKEFISSTSKYGTLATSFRWINEVHKDSGRAKTNQGPFFLVQCFYNIYSLINMLFYESNCSILFVSLTVKIKNKHISPQMFT